MQCNPGCLPACVPACGVQRFDIPALLFFWASNAVMHHCWCCTRVAMQVAEVLTATKGARMSISGWFHGAPLERLPFPLVPAPALEPLLCVLHPEPSNTSGLQCSHPALVS